jgi:signal transduction histidine kinase
MRLPALRLNFGKTQRELAMLLLASLGCVVALLVGIVGTAGSSVDAASSLSGRLLPIILVAGLAIAGAVATYTFAGRARRHAQLVEAEAKELRQRLSTAEALIRAEPQVLIYWEQGQSPRTVTHTLSGILGLPAGEAELMRFNLWLDHKSHAGLKEALEILFQDGKAFNMIIRTEAGGHLEADGRAAGARAVLRLRDVAGFKRDLGQIAERHAALARDVRSSRALLDALPIAVWLRNGEGRITWVNQAYVSAVDAASEQEVRERQIELLESRQRKAITQTLAQGKTYNERLPIIVGGERKSHDVIVLPLDDMAAGAAIDVAAVEKAQGELDKQVTAYDRTLDRVETAVAIFSPEKRLKFYNDAYQRMWQLDSDWLQSEPYDGDILDKLRELGRLPEVVHYRDWKAKQLSSYASASAREDWWNLPDGRFVHIIAEQRPDGGLTYLYADQTERYALESRYNALISVQSETLDSLKEGVAVFATDGRLQLYNAAFASIWKQSRDALAEGPHIDTFIRDVRVLYEDTTTWNRIRQAVTAFSSGREPLEGQMVRPDSSVIDYAASPLPDGGTLLTFADVTDSKRYERALVERNEALVAADKIKNQFIGNVSYELRTPLTNIIGFSELLASPFMGTLNDKQREYVDDIMSSSKTLLAIIDDILDLATIDAGALDLKLAPVDVRAVVKSAIMGVRDAVIRANLTLDIALADDVSGFIADESRVRQVLYNLLSNAVGFSKPGGVIHISCWREHGFIVFSVEDQGVGIPKEQQARVFDRFESRSQGSKHRGAGLGLSIAKNLVELHGGTTSLQSEPGVGTRVTVRLPERGKGHAQGEPEAQNDTPLAASRR